MAYNGFRIEDNLPDPTDTTTNRGLPFAIYLLNGSNNNMNVDGSGTPVTFSWYNTSTTYDVYIKYMIILMSDNKINYGGWGAGIPLTNGFQLYVKIDNTDILVFNAQTVLDMRSVCAAAEYIDNAGELGGIGSGNDDAIFLTFECPVPGGIRFDRNSTTDSIRAVVRDDHTGLSNLVIKIVGYEVGDYA